MGSMSLAVCLLFDREGDRAVREIWARLEADGVPTLLSHTHRRHRPHLSYVVALDWDLDRSVPPWEPCRTVAHRC